MKQEQALAILLVEDNAEQARLIRTILTNSISCSFDLTHVESLIDAESHLTHRAVAIVLMDLRLADTSPLESVRRIRKVAPQASIVLLSDAHNEQVALQAVQEGAQDYLIKGQIEPSQLIRALLKANARKTIEEALLIEKERAEVTLNCIGDAVICTDISGNITFLNPVAAQMTGWALEDAVGRPMGETFEIVDAFSRELIVDPMTKASSQNRVGDLPANCVLISRDGHEIFIEDSVAPIHDREGRVTGAVIVFRDVTATVKLEEQLTHSAEHDFLTGLPNRLLLNDRVSQAIALAHRNAGRVGVLFLDLDGFKYINDSLGHPIGDRVLQSVAERLLAWVRAPDTVCRLGGDEFVILIQELQAPEDAATTAVRLLNAIANVHRIDHHELFVTASIGVSVYPDDAGDAHALIRNADTAMYHAKKKRENYALFKPEMRADQAERRPKEAESLTDPHLFTFSTRISRFKRRERPHGAA